MSRPNFTSAEFTSALQALMPKGLVWPRESGSVQSKTLAGLAPAFARNSSRAIDLLIDAFPASSYELLQEWESTLGLPDTCSGGAPSLIGRQAQVVAKLTSGLGNTPAYFIGLAASIGFSITIQEYTPTSVDCDVDAEIFGDEWAHVWKVAAPPTSYSEMTVDSTVDDAFSYYGNAALECVLSTVAPANTTIIFNYT